MWLSNDDNTLEDKLSLQQMHLIESRIAKPETPLGVEACTRCCAMERAPLRLYSLNPAPYTIGGMDAGDCLEYHIMTVRFNILSYIKFFKEL